MKIPLPNNFSNFDPAHATSHGHVTYSVDTSPQCYLDFAISDFEESTNDTSGKSLINSLGNAKRALHLQVETLANAFGFKNAVCNKRYPNFHDYLDYCEQCGIVTPRILKKLNRVRNAVEHEYYIPTKGETEDFIDVVELFLFATERFIYQFPTFLEWLPGSQDVSVDGCPNAVELSVNSGELRLTEGERTLVSLKPAEPEFYKWLLVLIDGVHKGNFEKHCIQGIYE